MYGEQAGSQHRLAASLIPSPRWLPRQVRVQGRHRRSTAERWPHRCTEVRKDRGGIIVPAEEQGLVGALFCHATCVHTTK